MTEILFIFGCVSLAIRDPIAAPDATYNHYLTICESIFTSLHLLEVFLRSLADGLLLTPGSLLRQTGWGPFAAFSAVVSFLTLVVEVGTTLPMNHPLPILLRVLRSTRPVRLLQFIPSCAMVLYSLGSSMVQMGRVMAICGLVLIICSIEGVRTFRGLLRSCLVPDYGFVDGIGLKECETVYKGTWTSAGANFDNVGAAIVSVFTISTLEGWSDIMYDLMDSSSTYGDPMETNNSPWGAVYAIIVVLLMALLVMNLFASVLIDAYNTVKRETSHQKTASMERQEGSILLSQSRIFRCYSPQLQRQFLRDNPNVLGSVDFRLLSGLVPVSAVRSMQDLGRRFKKTMEELPGAVTNVMSSPTKNLNASLTRSILKKGSRINNSNNPSPIITTSAHPLDFPEFRLDVDPPSSTSFSNNNNRGRGGDEDEEEMQSVESDTVDLPPTPPTSSRSRSPSGSFSSVRHLLQQNNNSSSVSSNPPLLAPTDGQGMVVPSSPPPPPTPLKEDPNRHNGNSNNDDGKKRRRREGGGKSESKKEEGSGGGVVTKTTSWNVSTSHRHRRRPSADPDIALHPSMIGATSSPSPPNDDDGTRRLVFTLNPKQCRDHRLVSLLRGDIDDGSDDERVAPVVLTSSNLTLFDVEPELLSNIATEVKRDVKMNPISRDQPGRGTTKKIAVRSQNRRRNGTTTVVPPVHDDDGDDYSSSSGSSCSSSSGAIEDNNHINTQNKKGIETIGIPIFAASDDKENEEDAAPMPTTTTTRRVRFEDEVDLHSHLFKKGENGDDGGGEGSEEDDEDSLSGTFRNITSKIADIATASNAGIKNILTVQDETMDDYRTRARKIVRSEFVVFVAHGTVLASFVSMCWQTYPLSQEEEDSTIYLNTTFTCIFAVEALLKIFVETLPGYFSSKWNRLDFLVAVSSALGTVMVRFYDSNSFALAQAFRLVRLVRLGDGRLEIRTLIGKMGKAMFGLLNITIVYSVTLLTFALAGMELFGRVKQGAYGVSSGIDSHTTFRRVDKGLIILLRAMTGGNWPTLMLSLGRFEGSGTAFCDPTIGNCGLPAPIPELFFLLFVMISYFILRNLMMAILVDSFSGSAQNTAEKKASAAALVQMWLQIDTEGLLKLRPTEILSFIRQMPRDSILGFNHLPTMKRVSLELTCLTKLKLRDLHSPVPFAHLIDVLCTVAYPDVAELPAGRIFCFDPDAEEEEEEESNEDGTNNNNDSRRKGKQASVGVDPATSEDVVGGDSEFEIFAKRAAGVLIGYSLINIRRRRAARLHGGGTTSGATSAVVSRSVSMSRTDTPASKQTTDTK